MMILVGRTMGLPSWSMEAAPDLSSTRFLCSGAKAAQVKIISKKFVCDRFV